MIGSLFRSGVFTFLWTNAGLLVFDVPLLLKNNIYRSVLNWHVLLEITFGTLNV